MFLVDVVARHSNHGDRMQLVCMIFVVEQHLHLREPHVSLDIFKFNLWVLNETAALAVQPLW